MLRKMVGKVGGIFRKIKALKAGFFMVTTDKEVLMTSDNEILTFK